ncbi:MAG: mobile mystery protein B [Fuerstiella sp.]
MIDDDPHSTSFDPSGLKDKTIRTRSQLVAAEARNIAKALRRYTLSRPSKRLAPFDFSWALKLHRQMFDDVWEWAGQLREKDLNLGVNVHQINEELYRLLDDRPHWHEFGWPPIEQAAELHYQAVRIHPFPNGNGRWSRLLANIHLMQLNGSIVLWPAEVDDAVSPIRQEYVAALKAKDNGQSKPLLELHEQYHRDCLHG